MSVSTFNKHNYKVQDMSQNLLDQRLCQGRNIVLSTCGSLPPQPLSCTRCSINVPYRDSTLEPQEPQPQLPFSSSPPTPPAKLLAPVGSGSPGWSAGLFLIVLVKRKFIHVIFLQYLERVGTVCPVVKSWWRNAGFSLPHPHCCYSYVRIALSHCPPQPPQKP